MEGAPGAQQERRPKHAKRADYADRPKPRDHRAPERPAPSKPAGKRDHKLKDAKHAGPGKPKKNKWHPAGKR